MKKLFSGWHIPRWFQLVGGIILLVGPTLSEQSILIFPGIAFSAMALFNIGCPLMGSCGVQTMEKGGTEEVVFEEVKIPRG